MPAVAVNKQSRLTEQAVPEGQRLTANEIFDAAVENARPELRYSVVGSDFEMKVSANLSAVVETKPHEYATRFAFGGCVRVLAGIIAKKNGPALGGYFSLFPAIFPARATLISKHEKEKKHATGEHGSKRGRRAAGVHAGGAGIGAIGLLVFALLAWKLMVVLPLWVMLPTATVGWFAISMFAWKIWRT